MRNLSATPLIIAELFEVLETFQEVCFVRCISCVTCIIFLSIHVDCLSNNITFLQNFILRTSSHVCWNTKGASISLVEALFLYLSSPTSIRHNTLKFLELSSFEIFTDGCILYFFTFIKLTPTVKFSLSWNPCNWWWGHDNLNVNFFFKIKIIETFRDVNIRLESNSQALHSDI